MQKAVIVSAIRTACGKAPRGMLKDFRPEQMAAELIRELLNRLPSFDPQYVEDIILGCAMPEASQGMNIARIAALKAGLPVSIPAMTVNRFCSSGLQTIALAAERIQAGAIDCAIAGGVESMSSVPMAGFTFSPDPELASEWPDVYLGMGLTAENLARKYNISREEQDLFAFHSHRKAVSAQEQGRFRKEIVPLKVCHKRFENGKLFTEIVDFCVDEGPRKDTSLEALAKLKPAFASNGSVTAGNSSQRSDGAAVALVMNRKIADQLGLKPMALFRGYAVAGVDPEIMGIGPVAAIPKVLKKVGLQLEDMDLIELNEAFAVQALSVIKELQLDPSKLNVNGGAIALGHPLGCTGAKLLSTLLHQMAVQEARYGMVTMCIGGGMGAAGIFEACS